MQHLLWYLGTHQNGDRAGPSGVAAGSSPVQHAAHVIVPGCDAQSGCRPSAVSLCGASTLRSHRPVKSTLCSSLCLYTHNFSLPNPLPTNPTAYPHHTCPPLPSFCQQSSNYVSMQFSYSDHIFFCSYCINSAVVPVFKFVLKIQESLLKVKILNLY